MARYPEGVQRRLGILTRAGWLTGALRVPRLHTLIDFLENSGEFFRLSDVHLPHQENPLSFLALHRTAAMFVAPLDGMQGYDIAPTTTQTTVHDVSCLFDHGMLVGKLEILTGIRVSDYLMHRGGFIPVRECSLRGAPYLPPESQQTFALALVNRDRIVGVSESHAESTVSTARLPVVKSAGAKAARANNDKDAVPRRSDA